MNNRLRGHAEIVNLRSCMQITFILMLGVFFFVSGCSDVSSLDSENASSEAPVLELSPSFVLGENEQDNHYSFGAISAVRFLDDGRIAVLDRYACGALIFSPSGEYLEQIGGPGEGPGEFVNPSSMAAHNNKLVILDKWALRATLFDQQGNCIGELTDSWSFTPPSFIRFVSDSFIIAGVTTMGNSEGLYSTDYMVNVLSMDFQVVDTLFLSNFIYEPGNMTQMLQMSLFSCSYTTDSRGNMFVAEASPEFYEIQGWNLAGENFSTISRELDPVEKTENELLLETERITSMIEGKNPGVSHTYTPLPLKNQIPPNGVHADGQERLWVLNGFAQTPVFDVYSYEGELLFSVHMLGIDSNEIQEVLWWNVSEHGLAVFSRDPWEVPLVWVYDLPETGIY